MPTDQRPWFRVKAYGAGWGLPLTWEGWVVYVAYAGLMVLAWLHYPPDTAVGAFMASTVALTAVLVGICWLKGERRRTR